MEEVQKQTYVITDMKKRLKDILMIVSWRELSNTYFHKSSSWLYHKMDGIDGNGGQGGFTESEALLLRGALIDMSERLRKAAEQNGTAQRSGIGNPALLPGKRMPDCDQPVLQSYRRTMAEDPGADRSFDEQHNSGRIRLLNHGRGYICVLFVTLRQLPINYT